MTAIARLDAIAQDALARTGVPGMAIAVVYRDQVVYLKGFGVRDLESGAPVTPDTVFQLASVSKPIASTVIAALVGDGLVQWDDRLVDHLPEFALHDPLANRDVTLRDMFSHRSGLPDHAGDLLEDIGYGRDEVLARLRFLPSDYPFRAGYAYTNFGLTAAAVAAATAAGSTWEDVSQARLYQPLGMTSTSSRHADYVAAPDRATLHVREHGVWQVSEGRQPDAQSPAGGASSSVRDMAQWVRLHLAEGRIDGEQIVDAAALAETYLPHAVSFRPADPLHARASFYGLGWNVSYDEAGRVRLNHSGGFALGAATVVALAPAAELGIVVLTNGMPMGVPEAVSATFLDLALDGAPQRDWFAFYEQAFAVALAPGYTVLDPDSRPADPAPARALDAYTGVYANDYYGRVYVISDGETLSLQLGPERITVPLIHWDGDTFAYQPIGENADGLSAVTFEVDGTGRARSVTIDNLDVDAPGTLYRTAS